jgi:hypothetical protein
MNFTNTNPHKPTPPNHATLENEGKAEVNHDAQQLA